MNWKEADAIRLAFQRCAWALEDVGPNAAAHRDQIQGYADTWKEWAELIWKAAK